MAFSTTAASRTVRVSGPMWSREKSSGRTPKRLTRPYVGFSPTTPQKDAGMRMEPPVSVPIAAATMPDADRRAGAAARAAGNTFRIERVAHRTEVRIVRRDAVGQFVHVGLAIEDGARLGELFDHRGVRSGT